MTYARDHALADVTCPPYDVISRTAVQTYEAIHPHNIVRLILPRHGDDTDRYRQAAHELNQWLDDGVLERDSVAALYVYQLITDVGATIGLVGGIDLGSTILPHENTFPRPVADRVALMRATHAQLEPILLTYEGDGSASDIVDAVVSTEPLVETTTTDGVRHRVWRLTDPGLQQQISDDLAPRQALIADGHHRFAAYRQLHASAPGDGLGLAMLVDAKRHPLDLRGMHRSVSGLSFDTAVAAAGSGFAVQELPEEANPNRVLGQRSRDLGQTFVIGDGARWVLLTAPSPQLLAAAMPEERSREWCALDSAVLRHALIGKLWGLDDAEERVEHHHDPADAVWRARESGGIAALVRPPDLEDVLSLAERGERMPAKSTSFGPKPRTGLVMRLTVEG